MGVRENGKYRGEGGWERVGEERGGRYVGAIGIGHFGGRRWWWWLEGERTRMIRMEDKWKEREK